jgi:transposase
MRSITTQQRNDIISKLQSGLSVREVAEQIQVGRTTVNKVSKEFLNDRNKSKGGRPRKLTEADKRYCVHKVTRGRKDNAVQVKNEMIQDIGVNVSAQTVRRALQSRGMGSLPKEKKPALKEKNRIARLKWAKKYKDWTIDDWRRCIFSDETKINRYNSDGRVWSWIRDGESIQRRHISETVKHGGGSLMIWSCISCVGVGYVCKIDTYMDKDLYLHILKDELAKTVTYIRRNSQYKTSQLIFQHDNDSKHTSGIVNDYLGKRHYQVLDWPSQSPDLNPIEHMWALVKRRMNEYDTPPKGMEETWERVKEIWYKKITTQECLNVIDSMPRRIKACINAKGLWTKY